ncbi:hypothetical protein LTR09_006187 [Extremus antarcticus]|uniref:MYND-type domain-containing protein n=1 Tax=Extremus antarcticus TaxID=702011 RepID=A0AAJ0G8T6_9PEZI|nr:hypothetical protein LTR09_006187 [Extremus antarcticus]
MASNKGTCATCGKANSSKQCGRCRQVFYCSPECQKTDWKQHKEDCSPPDTLSALRNLNAPPSTASTIDNPASSIMLKALNTAEIRMAVFSLLPAKVLLVVQGVCRSWYHTIALETTLQQRLFFAAGPGELVTPAYEDDSKIALALKPRNKRQLDHANDVCKRSHLTKYLLGAEVKTSTELEDADIPIVLNPFFTKLWPQDPCNMTNIAYLTLSGQIKGASWKRLQSKGASWRRMQLTSPPMVQFDASIWATPITGPGTAGRPGQQLRPSTGHVATGVTLGHVADLLATIPKKLDLHWMMVDGHAWWARSTDAVMDRDPDAEQVEYFNTCRWGAYTNPSNGVPFPGFIGGRI